MVTSVADAKTLQPKGAVKVCVKDNVSQNRNRFTVKTQTRWSCLKDSPNKTIAVLFKGKTEKSISDLQVPQGAKLQYGPKGVVREDTNLDYYNWVLDDPEAMSEDEVVLVDWFAPNLMPSFDDLMEKKRRAKLAILGCTTGFIQNNDVTCHGPFSSIYKQREKVGSMQQLREGRAIPDTSKQVVLDRACASWAELDHDRISYGFVQIGVANDLFGTG